MLRREVLALFIVQLFVIYSLFTFNFYVGILLDSFQASALVIGIVFAVRNAVQIFLRVPFAELSQSVGRKPLILAGYFCYTSAVGLLYLATDWHLVLLGAVFLGTGMSLHWPALFSYVGDVSGTSYGRINGIIFQGQDIGIIISSLVASYVFTYMGFTLKQLFGMTWIIGISGLLLAGFILPEVLDKEHRKHSVSILKSIWTSLQNLFGSVGRLTRQYPLGLVFMYEMVVTFTEYFSTSFFPLLVVVGLGYTEGQAATIALISTVSLVLFKPYLGVLFDRFGFEGPIWVSLTISATFFFLMTFATNLIMVSVMYIITQAAFFTCFISTSGGTNNATDPKNRGLAMGVLGVYISSGRVISSVTLAPVLGIFETIQGSRPLGLLSLFRFTAVIVLILVLTVRQVGKRMKSRNQVTIIDSYPLP